MIYKYNFSEINVFLSKTLVDILMFFKLKLLGPEKTVLFKEYMKFTTGISKNKENRSNIKNTLS